jgi:signal transduction histidine kinase
MLPPTHTPLDHLQTARDWVRAFAALAHDLRAPLGVVAGLAELLVHDVRGPLTRAQQLDVLRIDRATRHALRLVTEAMLYVRVEGGEVAVKPRLLRVAPLLLEVEAQTLPILPRKRLTLDMAACDEALAVRADPTYLQQALSNLLDNAVRFTPSGGVIEVACHAAGPRIELTVHDTGIGIRGERLDEIFAPFVRDDDGARDAADAPPPGLGLGLTIARALVRAMDGDLTATSAPGAGSTFTIRLPRAAMPS